MKIKGIIKRNNELIKKVFNKSKITITRLGRTIKTKFGKVKFFNGYQKVLKKGGIIILTTATVLILSGCNEQELSPNNNVKYTLIDPAEEDVLENGIKKEEKVLGEDFKLVVNYTPLLEKNEHWTVTKNKDINMEIHTEGLPSDYTVYIDNVHIDIYVDSILPKAVTLKQDTMDDRIHNSQMMGFPISNNNKYSNIFTIEGSNDTFVSGYVSGYNGYVSGSFEEQTLTESKYLKSGIDKNIMESIIDLIIIKPDGTITCTSVKSKITISIWPFVEYLDNDGKKKYAYYYYENGDDKMTKSDYMSYEDSLNSLSAAKKRVKYLIGE